uniref:NADH dehydrogenase subunit 2 n=1 Tax=Paranoplocephala sp. RKZ13 TaxID=2854041 RepID=UPI001F1331F4|nr:NADH dehydrogenase subunit 2 [Paranoplocephala sp. RKZ13]UKS07979.1 NADH dehydrogenase subunit 2 [Paranoplocephala sp. RKZ13]
MVVPRLYSDLVFFSLFFSILFCILCSLASSLLGFWVMLELCGLSIVPCFFCSSASGVYNFYDGLLTYVVASGISSVILVSGLLFDDLYYFVYCGFAVKLGLFPFSLWVYRVVSASNWFFIFFLSVVLKFPVLFFCFLYQMDVLFLIFSDAFFTILGCCFLFWVVSNNWSYVWCHISIASVATLVVACFCAEASLCFFIYFYYFVWASFCICLFYYESEVDVSMVGFWVFCFLLLVTPLSLPLFYKLSVCLGLFYSSSYLLLIWGLYNFSEQFFLYKLGSDRLYSSVFNIWV